jgi:hypothetical protein
VKGSRTVDVTAVTNVNDMDDNTLVTNLVHHAILTASGRPKPRQATSELMTHAIGGLSQRSRHELVAGNRHRLG